MMKSRIFALMAAMLLMANASVIAQDTEDFTINGIKYTGDKTTMTATVTGTEDNFLRTDVVIPDEVNGYTVTSIQKKAFAKNSVITNFESPSTLLSIGYRAFAECKNLHSIKLYETLQSIDDAAFYKTESLEEIYIPNSVEYLGCAFGESGIRSIHLPENLETIEACCFGGCTNLQEINIPNSVTKIGFQAFSGCTSLKSVFISASVSEFGKTIGGYYGTFEYCPSLTSIIIDENNLYFDSRDNCNAIISTADNCLLMGCTGTIIPQDIQKIFDFAFTGSGITSIVIPDNVTDIGKSSFSDCDRLASVMLPQSITIIPDAAFSHCISLPTIQLPSSITSIGDAAFNHCEMLSNVTIPNAVASIGLNAFRHTAIQSLELPNSLTTIGATCFRGCNELTTLLLPKNLATIGRLAFADCSQLKTVTSLIEEPFELAEYVFESYDSDNNQWVAPSAILYVPKGTKEKYRAIAGWNLFKTILEEGEEPEEPVTIMAEDLTITYGDEIPTLTYTTEGATLNGQPQIECAATANSPAGEYSIIVSAGSVTNNNVTYVNGTLTITKAPLTIKADNFTKKQGQPLPTFTATYTGFKNGETEDVLTTKPTFNCEATATSALGTYDITVSGAEAQNYEISYEKGTLTVELLKGDVTGDGFLDSEDVIALVSYILGLGELANPAAAYINDDNKIDIVDLTLLIGLVAKQ